jgi:hypothetical protein
MPKFVEFNQHLWVERVPFICPSFPRWQILFWHSHGFSVKIQFRQNQFPSLPFQNSFISLPVQSSHPNSQVPSIGNLIKIDRDGKNPITPNNLRERRGISGRKKIHITKK